MKTENKIFLVSSLVSGLIYALLMALFDYSTGEEFKLMKFLFHFTFFGLSMGLLSRYNYKKRVKKEKKDTNEPPVK